MNEPLAHDHAELDRLLVQILNARDVKHSFELLDLFWARLAVHIRAEHLHLFPAIRQALARDRYHSGPTLAQADEVISKLRSDHEYFMRELAGAIVQLRKLLNATLDTPASQLIDATVRVQMIRERLVLHNRLEETQIYVWADSILRGEEKTTLNRKIMHELGNLPPRFADTILDYLAGTEELS